MSCVASLSAVYLGRQQTFRTGEFPFSKLLKLRATFIKLHWANSGTCLFLFFFFFRGGLLTVCRRKHNIVNVHCAGEMLHFGLCNFFTHTDASIVQLSSGWKLAKKKNKTTTADYLLTQNEKKHFAVLLWLLCFLYVPHSFPRGNFCRRLDLLCFPNGALCGNASYVQWRATEFYAWSLLKHRIKKKQHVTGFPFYLKGYVVVFWTTPPLTLCGKHRVNRSHCWLELLTQQ